MDPLPSYSIPVLYGLASLGLGWDDLDPLYSCCTGSLSLALIYVYGLIALMDDTKDDESSMIGVMYENNPDIGFSNFAAYELKLIEEIRIKLEEIAIEIME